MKNFNEVRRKERILDENRALELLQTAEYGFLSLGNSENGYAYGIPISFAYDKEANLLYFHCAMEGHKLENLKRNICVSFCIVGKTQVLSEKFSTIYESVIVFGKADINPTDNEKRLALMKLVEKYCPKQIVEGEVYIEKSLHKTQTFSIKIEHITAKARKS
jgi:nitroimidazol reductase NimA-like FMN-containing flavoprotein (pyridoxamine 5'-phosphate oxidase superfamily)